VGERRLALTRAREHGLDMDRVAVVAAERTIERAFEVSDATFLTYQVLMLNFAQASSAASRPSAVYYCIAASADRRGGVLVEVNRVDNVLGCNV
jgi:hypothetical protein